MIRGTTPTYTFTLPFDTVLIENCVISFKQEKALEKELPDCTLEDKTISLTLTQEETLQFKAGVMRIELGVLLVGGKRISSKAILEQVDDTDIERVI